MEYGLWNLHGGFWAGSNPCGGDSVGRSLYNPVSASGTGPFHGCGENVSFPTVTATPPCRSTYRSQPEYVAMKPAVIPTRTSTNGLEIGNGHTGERAEQQAVMPLQNDVMAEHSSVESINSLHGQPGLSTASLSSTMSLNPLAQSSNMTPRSDATTIQTHKKAKSAKHQRKNMSGSNKSESNDGTGTWNRSNASVKTESTLQYLNQQYNPMYSMMFGRLPAKRLDNVSDESDDDDDDVDDNDENDNDNDNEVDGDGYSNQSAIPNRSPECLGSQTSTTGGGRSGYECGECGLVADTRPGLKKHIAVCHPVPGPDPNIAQALLSKIAASCPMASCRFRTSERDELEAHVARHVAEGYSPTGKKRAGPVSLQRVRYEREEYHCQMCAYTCTIEKAFYKHLKLHSLGLGASSIKISCVICGKDRPTEVDMNKHMRKHRDNRYFCCDICIFRTVQLKKLIQHRRMHTGEKPHLCPHCAYRSARRDNLRSHVRRVHKKENLYCDTFSPRGLLLAASSSQPEPASPNPSQD